MLLEFKVKNYLSIRDEMALSLIASSKTKFPESVVNVGKDAAFTTNILAGPNASGKSALIEAMSCALSFLQKSRSMMPGELIYRVVPFKFDEATIGEPSCFEFTFIAAGKKYIYGFSATSTKVYDEYLYKYGSAKKSLIFERNDTTNYKFPIHLEATLNDIKTKNDQNKLFLSTASVWNFYEAIVPFKWLVENITIFHAIIPNLSYVIPSDEKTKKFVLDILSAADLNIVDYTVSRQKIQHPAMPEKVDEVNVITTYHNIYDSKGKIKKFSLNLSEESVGTQKMFYLALILKLTFNGKVVIFDEIENDLHSHLVEFVVKLFNSKATNPNGAQLIFSTHTRTLIDDDIFDHAQINFLEKDEHSGASTLYKLSDFSIRNNLNIEKAYNNGRFGAVPFIKHDGVF